MYTIKFDFPNLPKGGEIDITGLAVIFENGKEYSISKTVAEGYRLHNQHPVVPTDPDPQAPIKYELGPTLLDAFKDHPHVTVKVVEALQKGEK